MPGQGIIFSYQQNKPEHMKLSSMLLGMVFMASYYSLGGGGGGGKLN